MVLLDEADVYISERGTDLYQNAIVAAFLRVLENHTATIFMTTNRLDKVDDAVASRCLARIEYEMPSRTDQFKIWSVLNAINGVGLGGKDIDEIMKHHHNLSGRDIKQLLKLGQLWSQSRSEPVSPDTIDFVKRFLPTNLQQHEAGPRAWCCDV